MNNRPNLALAEYSFVFKAAGQLTMPAFAENLWHGVFGKALHTLSCIAPSSKCHTCMLQTRCDYAFLFKGVRPEGAEMMRKYPHVPVPHVFHLGNQYAENIASGDFFSQNIVLIGTANYILPAVIRAMATAGLTGLGRDRTKAELKKVVQLTPAGSPITILEHQEMLDNPIIESIQAPQLPDTALPIRLQLVTPFLPSKPATQVDQLELPKLLMTIVRRVSMLQYFYMGDKLEADFKALKHCVEKVKIIDNGLMPWTDTSYDRKQGKRIKIKGVHGYLDLDSQSLKELWSYLYLGQWLHLGKRASMGFGQYQLLNVATA